MLGAVALTLVAFGARPADPARAEPTLAVARHEELRERAGAAAASLPGLRRELRAALELARRGSARIVAGETQPGPALAAAAERLDAARPAAERADDAVRALLGTAAAVGSTDAPGTLEDATPAALAGVAEQLRGTTNAADEFSQNRHEAEAVVVAFGEALAAMDRDDPHGAVEAIGRAAGHLEAVAAWEPEAGLPTLRFWLETMTALLDASRRAAQAAAGGDREAAARAVRDWEAAAEDAHRADVALGIALAEGGNLVAAAPLRRLAAALSEVDAAEGQVASLVHLDSARSLSEQAGTTR
jgi:hypothetical protein